jgi:hypothetical protein
MNQKPFTITSFKWKKEIEENLNAAGEKLYSDEVILRILSSLACFLDRNGLSTRKLAGSDGTVDQDFELNSTDLTPEGLQTLRKGYEKWMRQAKTPEDVRPLEKALQSIRG